MRICERDSADIYMKYRDKVMGFVRGKVTNSADAEDLVQAVFLKVYASLEQYDEEKAALSTWIYTITRNTVYDYLRGKRDHPSLELMDDSTPDGGDAPEAAVLNDEALEELACALQRLPQEQRDAVILLYYHGLDRKTVAQRMGITYGQLRYLHDKALKRLGELLN